MKALIWNLNFQEKHANLIVKGNFWADGFKAWSKIS